MSDAEGTTAAMVLTVGNGVLFTLFLVDGDVLILHGSHAPSSTVTFGVTSVLCAGAGTGARAWAWRAGGMRALSCLRVAAMMQWVACVRGLLLVDVVDPTEGVAMLVVAALPWTNTVLLARLAHARNAGEAGAR